MNHGRDLMELIITNAIICSSCSDELATRKMEWSDRKIFLCNKEKCLQKCKE